MSLRAVREDILRIPADPAVLGHFAAPRPLAGAAGRLDWLLNGALSRAWKKRPDLFEFGRLTLVATGGRFPFPRVLVVGLGAREKFRREERRDAYRAALAGAQALGAIRTALECFPLQGAGDPFSGAEEDLTAALQSLSKRPPEVLLAQGPAGRRG